MVFIPNKMGGSLYPCNRMISCLPCWTFSTNTSSGASMSSQRNRMINRSCIPGGMMPLFSTMDFTITRNFERYGLPLIWNLAGTLLMFRSVTVFYNNVLLESFTLLWFSNLTSFNFNFNFVFKRKSINDTLFIPYTPSSVQNYEIGRNSCLPPIFSFELQILLYVSSDMDVTRPSDVWLKGRLWS